MTGLTSGKASRQGVFTMIKDIHYPRFLGKIPVWMENKIGEPAKGLPRLIGIRFWAGRRQTLMDGFGSYSRS